jgi:hypothetical protein
VFSMLCAQAHHDEHAAEAEASSGGSLGVKHSPYPAEQDPEQALVVRPVVAPNLPAGHGVQAHRVPMPVALYWPAGHLLVMVAVKPVEVVLALDTKPTVMAAATVAPAAIHQHTHTHAHTRTHTHTHTRTHAHKTQESVSRDSGPDHLKHTAGSVASLACGCVGVQPPYCRCGP